MKRYDEEQKEGAGTIEAAGDACNAVLEEPLEREREAAKKPWSTAPVHEEISP